MIFKIIFNAFFIFCILGQISLAEEMKELKGDIFGSNYSVKYFGNLKQSEVNNFLTIFFKEFNQEFSTYQFNSTVSTFNRSLALSKIKVSERFIEILEISKKINNETNGAFDPSISPAINLWNESIKNKNKVPTKNEINEVKNLIGYQWIKWDVKDKLIWKLKNGIALDLDAFAPGYAVDLIANYLTEQKVSNFLIDISGELRAKGKKHDGSAWQIGIENPDLNKAKFPLVVPLENIAISTSGNYRQFYINNGENISHIIDPISLMPGKSKICSATVIHESALTADALSTALMVMGEKAIQFSEENDVKCYLIFCDKKDSLRILSSTSFNKYLKK